MTERYGHGAAVRVAPLDPAVHTRVPRYVRGHVGTVIEAHGRHRLPDDVVAGVEPPAVETVYAIRFQARELWGDGDHCVIVDLFESYLAPAERATASQR